MVKMPPKNVRNLKKKNVHMLLVPAIFNKKMHGQMTEKCLNIFLIMCEPTTCPVTKRKVIYGWLPTKCWKNVAYKHYDKKVWQIYWYFVCDYLIYWY